jgi:hypothetical protein
MKNLISKTFIKKIAKEFFNNEESKEKKDRDYDYQCFMAFVSKKKEFEEIIDLQKRLSCLREKLKYQEITDAERENFKAEGKSIIVKLKVTNQLFYKIYYAELYKKAKPEGLIIGQEYADKKNEEEKCLDNYINLFNKIFYDKGAFFISKLAWNIKEIRFSRQQEREQQIEEIINNTYDRIWDILTGTLFYNDKPIVLPDEITEDYVIDIIKKVLPIVDSRFKEIIESKPNGALNNNIFYHETKDTNQLTEKIPSQFQECLVRLNSAIKKYQKKKYPQKKIKFEIGIMVASIYQDFKNNYQEKTKFIREFSPHIEHPFDNWNIIRFLQNKI